MIVDYARAKRRARFMRYGVIAMMVLIVLCNIFLNFPDAFDMGVRHITTTESFSPALAGYPELARINTVLISAICLAGLYRLMRLMKLFELGDFFGHRSIRHLQAFSLSILLATVVDCILPPIELLGADALRIGHVRGVYFGVDSTDVLLGFISAIFFVIALIMAEAGKLAEDSQL